MINANPNSKKVPWFKLYIGEAEQKEVNEVVRSGWMSMGPKTQAFEKRMASYVGVKHAVALNSGTAALDIALKVLNVGPGDEVIVPAMTYIATANAVLYQHATPVFADIDPQTLTLDPKDVEKKITSKTKAIIPVNYGGLAANYEALQNIATRHGLKIVEDAAPSLGGTYKNKRHCSLGDISITSFHTAKIFTSIEGGMIFTDSDEYNEMSRIIRSQGEDPKKKYHHPVLGHNFRLSDIHAAVGLAQTEPARMEAVLTSRRRAAEYYLEQLKKIPQVVLPYMPQDSTRAWFLFPILIPHRDQVRAFMLERGVETNVSWPMPIYAQKPYLEFNAEKCPVSERVTQQILCLPMYYELTPEEQDHVMDSLQSALQNTSL